MIRKVAYRYEYIYVYYSQALALVFICHWLVPAVLKWIGSEAVDHNALVLSAPSAYSFNIRGFRADEDLSQSG